MKKLLPALAFAGALSVMPMQEVHAQVNGTVEHIQSEESENTYLRGNFFYGLPGGINGYSFVELYRGDNGFFGKTMLTKKLTDELGLKVEALHSNSPLTQVGVGACVDVPMPEGSSLNIKGLPVYFDENGVVDDKAVIGYSGSVKLPGDFKLSSFGEINVGAKGGPEWGYGEIFLGRELGNIIVGYNPALKNDGDLSPRLEHRVTVGVRF